MSANNYKFRMIDYSIVIALEIETRIDVYMRILILLK